MGKEKLMAGHSPPWTLSCKGLVQRGVDAGDQHALSTQAERAGTVRQEQLELLDRVEDERDWIASEDDQIQGLQAMEQSLQVSH